MKKYAAILVFILSFTGLFAQINVNCDNYSSYIGQLYNNGNYFQILDFSDSLLHSCKFTREQKLNIYKYSAAAAYEIDNDSLFLLYGRLLYKVEPHFTYQQGVDPTPLAKLKPKFVVYPKYTLGISLGINTVYVDRINVYQMMDSMDVSEPYYSLPAMSASIVFQYNISRRLSMAYYGGIYFSDFYKRNYFYNGLVTSLYKETIQGISNQALLKISFPLRRIPDYVPYIIVGGFFDFKYKAIGRISLSKTDDSTIIALYPDFKLPRSSSTTIYYKIFSMHPMRSMYNYGYTGGLGLNYRSEDFAFFTEILFQKGYVLHNIPDIRYLSSLLRNYYYVDNDIVLNKLFIRIGFTYNFKYKVEKR